jgi:ariadne-1
MTPCPLKGCNLYLTRSIFKKYITEKKYQLIFAKSLVRNFIARSKNIKSCPNPRCNLSIRVPVSLAKEIKCRCGWNFCFLCLEESHVPCDCEMAKLWRESTREKGSGEDFIWMKENTKNCPKCGINIQKNQGCNHMTCQRKAGGCGFEFCWVCLGPWNAHMITSIDSYYTCLNTGNKQEKKKEKKKKEIPEKFRNKFKDKKKDLLDRYIQFYQSWDSHRNSLQFAYKLKDRVKEFKNNLINKKGMLEIDVNYLDDSLNMIIECNRLLKNIFVYEYFLDESSNYVLFENNLEILQNQTDSLLELIELNQLPNIMKIEEQKKFQEEYLKYKDHNLSLIKSTQTFKKNLIDEIENNINVKINYETIKELDDTLKVVTRSKKK